jgi:hypothetical protein
MTYRKFADLESYQLALRAQLKKCEDEDGPLRDEELGDRYDATLSLLVSELSQAFDLKESAGDCDLSYYSYVPPSREIVLVVNNVDLDGNRLVRMVSEVLGRLPLRVVVSLDSVSYVTMAKGGEVLGYSKYSDLSEYGF